MSLTVEIEYCKNCHLHSWCSRHDEIKYIDFFEQLSKRIIDEVPYCNTIVRALPSRLTPLTDSPDNQKYFDEENGEVVFFPRLGSFEIYADDNRIFSKIKSGKWPKFDNIISTLKKMVESKLSGK